MSELKGKMTHPDPEALAEFRAGLITGRRGARVSAHLAACERCAARCGQLAEVSAVLAAVPAPAMPDIVAQRLEGVLAVEAAQRYSAERAVDSPSPDRTGRPQPRRHWDFRLVALRVLAPAAAVAVLAAGGYGLSRIGESPASSQATSSGVASAASPARAGAAAAPSAGPASRTGEGPAIKAPQPGVQVVTSGTDYRRGTLRQQLAHEMAMHARGAAGPQAPASASVEECVRRVTQGTSPGTLKLVELARFQDQPAIVIVAENSGHDAAWVTTAACSAILARTTLPGTSAA